jgi:indolepyruvate ferredoxin oxidoreductase alpha subunit
MGASIGVAHGMDKARGPDFAGKTVAVIGESTCIHSGITGIIDIVYNKGNSTVLVLDNEITGMTGRQEHPATGRTIRGEPTYRVDIAELCRALGVKNVRTEDPFDVTALEKAVKEETQRPEASVIIVRRPCVMLGAYKPAGPVEIDPDKCTRCRLCMGISCAAISDQNGVMSINQALCARCGLCSAICRFGAITPKTGEEGGGARA